MPFMIVLDRADGQRLDSPAVRRARARRLRVPDMLRHENRTTDGNHEDNEPVSRAHSTSVLEKPLWRLSLIVRRATEAAV